MKLSIVAITSAKKPDRKDPAYLLADDYAARSLRLAPCESLTYATETALFEAITRQTGRAPTQICLFDSTGDTLTSLEFASYIGRVRDGGTQRIILAIGPASGWSEASLRRAHRILSLGKITLPHELARVLVAEQVYRALTILAGHPYHLGH